ncbi:hypothetical protein ACU5P1_12600 [Pseudomonas plecoglossicida]|uniref:Lipoprotein n=1 Tax=Pseudomonas plecoglossicida TaxID=70775 RepID=A0AAD0VS71_PSEDL|nr:hypothetical protein [Pseudomonas plecoglossicida]AXM94845.1 hypothetical protein DVB73_02935 [Pseudomonas plecoglossicida]EPB97806.1 hypothetical protein L321_01159 [Pseudomonas plecoglossicida NB2011]QLB55587.1 hypothetical protein HAV28_12485 [Pseudomonas plecoglossicida]GLR36240.1 hypothetical protein GCM10011247_16370 [Pseudomonas plecoglossicida]
MRNVLLICLVSSLALSAGCFDRDNNHPGKDSDPSKPSLQMQQPDTPPTRPPTEPKPQNP